MKLAVLFIVGVVYYLVGGLFCLEVLKLKEINVPLFVMGYVVIAVIIFFLMRKKESVCPKCKKNFAMKEVKRENVGSKTDFKRRLVLQNRSNGKTESVYKYVNVETITYKCVDKCKYCGYEKEEYRFSEIIL